MNLPTHWFSLSNIFPFSIFTFFTFVMIHVLICLNFFNFMVSRLFKESFYWCIQLKCIGVTKSWISDSLLSSLKSFFRLRPKPRFYVLCPKHQPCFSILLKNRPYFSFLSQNAVITFQFCPKTPSLFLNSVPKKTALFLNSVPKHQSHFSILSLNTSLISQFCSKTPASFLNSLPKHQPHFLILSQNTNLIS